MGHRVSSLAHINMEIFLEKNKMAQMNKTIEKFQDNFFIALTFIIFCITDLYILIKGYFNVYKEKYFNRK